MKLNLGCGSQILPGYVNVDKFGTPDLRHDLEVLPWPWPDDSVAEILLSHTLEHLGQQTGTFIAIIQEMHRVCRDGAQIRIVVPHPRHDTFLNDPTHVRAITPGMMEMFSRQANLQWQRAGGANTPLALYHGVDFELVSTVSQLDEPYLTLYRDGKLSVAELQEMERSRNNVVLQVEILLRAVKTA